MYKQSPSRNHRSKGIKVKNVLQICLLLAVCFWLIYQVKHSHDKKKEFDEDDTKSSIKTENSNELMKLGRKDLLPRNEGMERVNEKHKEEPEDETVEEEEEEEGNKPEEEDLEENKTKEKNDEHGEDGEDEADDHDQEKNDEHREDEVDDHDQEKNDEHREDEVDDHDQEKSDVELDQEEDAIDEDKERGEDNEKETEERDSEVNDSQVEGENSLEDHDHEEDSSSSHEAREEHYKADDASSAVTHDTENESRKLEQEAEHAAESKSEVGVNNSMQINADQNTTLALKVEDGKADGEGSPPNTTNSEEKHDDPISSTAADTSVSNSTRTEGLTDNSELRTDSAELSTQTRDLFLQNGTQAVNQEYNATLGDTTSGGSNLSISSSQQNGNSADTVVDNQIDSNLTFSSKRDEVDSIPVDSSNVSGDTELSLVDKVTQGNAAVEAVNNVELPLKDSNAIEVEKADASNEEIGTTDEAVDASIAENLVEVQDDPIDTSDSSIHLEEKHIRTDVETLPEIQTEGNVDAAAE